MATNLLLIAGGFCWAVAGVVAVAHLLDGDLLVPAAMSTVAVAWIGLRYRMSSVHREAVPAEIETAA